MECENFTNKNSNKSGYNINNYIDIGQVSSDFIENYFKSLKNNNIDELINNKVLREYTSIKYDNNKLQGENLIEFLNTFSNYNIQILKYNYINSGSRRIDISTVGLLTNESENINFNQTFILCNQDNSWYIKNSIFLIF
jgi:hypothetical protein